MPLQVVFSARARRQLTRIEAYIASLSFPENGKKYIVKLHARCQRIGLAPQQGARRDDISPGVRSTGFDRRATIVFRVDGDVVTILAISYAGQLYGPG